MICYQTRYEDGVFVGVAFADEDPEVKDRMVLPGGCVATPPPPYGNGQQARWADDTWVIEASPLVFLTHETPPVGMALSWDGTEIVSTRVSMPDLTDQQTASWNGSVWTVADILPQPPAPEMQALTPEQKLAAIGLTADDLKSLLASD
jgi:hypothetical protein